MRNLRALADILAGPFLQATAKEKIACIIAAVGIVIICMI